MKRRKIFGKIRRPAAFLLVLMLVLTLLPLQAAAENDRLPTPTIISAKPADYGGYHAINVRLPMGSGIVEHLVEYREAGSTDDWQTGGLVRLNSESETLYWVNGLKENTRYDFRVTALGYGSEFSDSAPSATAAAMTASTGGMQSGSENVVPKAEQRENDIFLSCDEIIGTRNFRFRVYGEESDGKPYFQDAVYPSSSAINGVSIIDPPSNMGILIENPGKYVFRAQAEIMSTSGDYYYTPWNPRDKDVTFDVRASNPVENVTADDISDTEIALTWDHNSSGDDYSYLLSYKESGEQDWITTDKDQSDLTTDDTFSYTFSELKPYTSYDFSVQAINGNSNNIFYLPSAAVTIAGIKTAPARPMITAAVPTLVAGENDRSVLLKWNAAAGAAIDNGYKIEYRVSGQTSWTQVNSPSIATEGAICSTTVSGLQAGTSYEFRIKTVGDNLSSSPWSEASAVTPPKGATGNSDSGFYISTGGAIFVPASAGTITVITGSAVLTGSSAPNTTPPLVKVSNGAHLTLQNVVLNRMNGDSTAPAVEFLSGGALTVSGNNTIMTTETAISSSNGALEISGDGTLTIISVGTGIDADTLTFSGAAVTVNSVTAPAIHTAYDLNIDGNTRLSAKALHRSDSGNEDGKYALAVGKNLSVNLSSGGKAEIGIKGDDGSAFAVHAGERIVLGGNTKIAETANPENGTIITTSSQSIGISDENRTLLALYVRMEYQSPGSNNQGPGSNNQSSGSNHSSGSRTPKEEEPLLNKNDHIAYLSGYPDGTVRPQSDITREETTAIFCRLLDEETRSRCHSTQNQFPDVTAERWSNESISTMAKADIVSGYPDGTFKPEGNITRAEFAAIAVRFDSKTYEGSGEFSDISGHWAEKDINRAAAAGWISGYPDGTFKPDQFITRAEAVTLINRMLDRLPETAKDLLSDMKTWRDNADTEAWYYLAIQEAGNGHEFTRKSDGVHETWLKLK